MSAEEKEKQMSTKQIVDSIARLRSLLKAAVSHLIFSAASHLFVFRLHQKTVETSVRDISQSDSLPQ